MSYMDRKNILSEGLIDKLLMKILKLDKKALKNPKVKKAFDRAVKQNKDTSKYYTIIIIIIKLTSSRETY